LSTGEHAALLSVLDHRQGDAVLDAPPRIAAFELHPHSGAVAVQATQPDVVRAADVFENVFELHVAVSL
jgi:hypothetical protein